MPHTAIIKAIDEYAVHDGAGSRSLVFLKGCSLRCKWCQNPENQGFEPELWFHRSLCVHCGACRNICPVGAVRIDDDLVRIDKSKCLGVSCSKCVGICTKKAYKVVGYSITSAGLWRKLSQFKPFYQQRAGGGVTLTGGEPLHHPDFAAEVLQLCQEDSINTAIETSLYAPWNQVNEVVSHCDFIMADIKHMDSKKHIWGTGVPNEQILSNFRQLNTDFKHKIVVRIPLIPGFNDDEENIVRTAEFIKPLEHIEGLDLLPFNVYPVAKYEALGEQWAYQGIAKQSEDYLHTLYDLAAKYSGKHCTLGGTW